MSKLMKDPVYYKMLKEKPDGITLGVLKFPILFNDTIYLFPKDAGETLVKEGWAVEINSNENKIRSALNVE